MKNVKGNVLFWSLSVSLGGLLFGFDTAVISGGEQAIQKLWSLSNFMVGQMVAMGLYGTIVGALFGIYAYNEHLRIPQWIGVALSMIGVTLLR